MSAPTPNYFLFTQILLLVGSDVKVPASTSGYPITIAVKSDSVLSIQALVAHAPEQLNLRVN